MTQVKSFCLFVEDEHIAEMSGALRREGLHVVTDYLPFLYIITWDVSTVTINACDVHLYKQHITHNQLIMLDNL